MLREADAVGVQIDIDPAAPAPELDGHEVEIVVGQGFGGPFVTVDDFRDSAVELPRPAVIFAEEAGGVAAAFGDRPAAVRADIVIGLDLVGSDAAHVGRLVADFIGVETAEIWAFLFPPST